MQVRNVISRLQECSRFFLNSPKRSGLLDLIVNHNVVDAAKRKPLLDLCKTCWAERHFAYQHFYQAFVFIIEALEMISFKRHLAKYGDKYAGWDAASCSNAQQILASITTFEFIVVFMSMYQYLSHLSGITVKPQKRALDIVEANEMISKVATYMYKDEQKNVDSSFDRIYAQSVTMAEKVEAVVSMPHILPQGSSTKAMLKLAHLLNTSMRNVAIPVLDHIITSIDQQFLPSAIIIATSLLGLVPSVLFKKEVNLEAALNTYSTDLLSPELFHMHGT